MVCFTHKLNLNTLHVAFYSCNQIDGANNTPSGRTLCPTLPPNREALTFNASKYNSRLIHFPIYFGFERSSGLVKEADAQTLQEHMGHWLV